MPLPLVCRCRTDKVHCFDDKTRKPCTGTCGHTVCLKYAMCCSKCPVCQLEGAFNKVSVNYTSIALLNDCRKRFWENWGRWMDTKAPDAGFCSNLFKETQLLCSICVDPVKIPRICLTCDEEKLFKRNRWQLKQHNAIVLELLQRVMCSNCAIDNHGEKGHEIVKQEINKKSKKLIAMALAQNVLNMCKDAIENKKGVIDCSLRRLKIEMSGQNLLKIIEEMEYVEEWECGYLGELIRQELIKKYMKNVDEKMLDLLRAEGNSVCDCSRHHEKQTKHRIVVIKPQIFDTGCPLYTWEYMTEESSDIYCPLCLYNGYSQHRKMDFFLENGVSIIGEFCKTGMIPLDKCCLKCLDCLNNCRFLLSCEHRKKKHHSYEKFTDWYHEKKLPGKKKSCYQNCFMKDSTLWNFVIINHMMTDNNLYEVIMQEIEQTDGFIDCQLQKVRMKETINELFEGLRSFRCWDYFDHLSKPIEMTALLENFKMQWNSFRFGKGERSQCKCISIWNKVLKKKVEKEEYKDLETKMIDMARYSMTEEINGCPMEYNHGIELDMKELEDTVCFESTKQETLARDEQVASLMKKIVSNIFPFAHLHCQNEKEQLFDNKAHQPYTGSCGHTVCLVCIEKRSDGDCPVCGKEGSFEGQQLNEELVQEIDTIKQNAWEMFKELWNNEAADSGACSECNKSSSELYLCDIINFTTGSRWRKRLIMKSTADVLRLSRQVLCQECASVRANATEKVNTIPFWKNDLKKSNGIFLLELLEDDIQKNRNQLIKVLEKLNYEKKRECGYDRELIKQKLIEKLMEHLDQQQPTKTKNCSMCVTIADIREVLHSVSFPSEQSVQ